MSIICDRGKVKLVIDGTAGGAGVTKAEDVAGAHDKSSGVLERRTELQTGDLRALLHPGSYWRAVSPCTAGGLAFRRNIRRFDVVWDQPYLETCCRAALHRLHLCGQVGRPAAMLDGSCLDRLASMGLCCRRGNGRFVITLEGVQRHANEILKSPADGTTSTKAR